MPWQRAGETSGEEARIDGPIRPGDKHFSKREAQRPPYIVVRDTGKVAGTPPCRPGALETERIDDRRGRGQIAKYIVAAGAGKYGPGAIVARHVSQRGIDRGEQPEAARPRPRAGKRRRRIDRFGWDHKLRERSSSTFGSVPRIDSLVPVGIGGRQRHRAPVAAASSEAGGDNRAVEAARKFELNAIEPHAPSGHDTYDQFAERARFAPRRRSARIIPWRPTAGRGFVSAKSPDFAGEDFGHTRQTRCASAKQRDAHLCIDGCRIRNIEPKTEGTRQTQIGKRDRLSRPCRRCRRWRMINCGTRHRRTEDIRIILRIGPRENVVAPEIVDSPSSARSNDFRRLLGLRNFAGGEIRRVKCPADKNHVFASAQRRGGRPHERRPPDRTKADDAPGKACRGIAGMDQGDGQAHSRNTGVNSLTTSSGSDSRTGPACTQQWAANGSSRTPK